MFTTKFYVCGCYLTRNIFIKKYALHCIYESRSQFLQDYSETLQSAGCNDPDEIIPEIESEVTRRKNFHNESWDRRLQIARDYSPIHPPIFTLQKSFLDSKFVQLVELAKQPDCTPEVIKSSLKDHDRRMYTFPVFTQDFCCKLVQELMNFEDSSLPKGRPNTMNRYGIHLGELGFDKFITSLRTDYIIPLTKLLYPDWGGGCLDSHKAFIVKYEEGKDVDLSYHFDNAEITLNVPLNEDYYDGEVYFGPMKGEESSRVIGIAHQLGVGLLHRGLQMHGALPISEGVRYNLILWLRSSEIRNELCPMCDEKPNLVPVKNGFGDGFTVIEADVCSTS